VKIAVVGCGAVGSFYGAKLAQAGHAVHFLLRSDYAVVRRQGVFVRSPEGDFHVQPRCALAPEEIGPCDLVLIGLKTTANDQFSALLPALVNPATAVLTLQNGLGNEDLLARIFSVQQIMGGLCFVCLNRSAPGVIQHLGYGQIVLGEFEREPQSRTRALAQCFNEAGIRCIVADNLARAHWEKLVWNIPFNGLGVAGAAGYEALAKTYALDPLSDDCEGLSLPPRTPASDALECLTTDRLLADPGWSALTHELMLEVISAGRAVGFDVPDSLADGQIERTRSMGAYKASTLIDFERGLPLELQSLFLEPLRRGRQAGHAMPRLTSLCVVLTALDRITRR
jgi:2-dehydropantoate 2-reductase